MRGAAGLNLPLRGAPGSRNDLETPALLLDLEVFEANIAAMASMTKANNQGLRPHAKTHKCATIARHQLEAGALGIACAKSGELLALFKAGIRPLMLTAPLASPLKIARLAEAAAAGCALTVVVDRQDLVAAFGSAARSAGAVIEVLVDVDCGLGRLGVTTPEGAVALARAIAAEPGLSYAGVQAYAGQVQHIHALAARRAANRTAGALLAPILAALRNAGLPPRIVTGGGSGSAAIDGEDGLFTEIQAGSYVFMDEGYRPVEGLNFGFALFVAVSVIGHSNNGEAIIDAGSKSFAIDGPPPMAHIDGVRVGTIAWAGDEFGRLITDPGRSPPPVGTRIECTVPHCDPTANLHDYLHVVRGQRLIDFWPIEARGLSD